MSRMLGRWAPGGDAWRDARRARIGGSEIGTVCGWNRYETAEELLARKRGELPPRPDTDATLRGRYLEAGVLQWLADREGFVVDPAMQGTWVHDDHDIALFTPDAVTTDGRLVEIKTAAVKDAEEGWGRAGTSQIPLAYQAQCQWGLGILGLTGCLVGVCFGTPFEFRRYRVKFDRKVFDHLLRRAAEFVARLNQTREAA